MLYWYVGIRRTGLAELMFGARASEVCKCAIKSSHASPHLGIGPWIAYMVVIGRYLPLIVVNFATRIAADDRQVGN